MANRNQRQQIAKETVTIMDQGFYISIEGKQVQIADQMKQCNENSRVYTEKDFTRLLPPKVSKQTSMALQSSNTTEFEITNEYSITACIRLATELSAAAVSATATVNEKIVCLNFASAKNPGGGFLNGSLAQEESISLCSCLYSSLTQFHEQYYEINRKDPRDALYHNMLVYSPGCTIFREDVGYTLLEKAILASFVSCPAVNRGVALKKGIKAESVSKEMLRRMQLVLRVCAENGYTTLILGAWGCGVFRNEPQEIAKQFADLLLRNSAPYKNVFRKVIFAVGKEQKKLDIFKNVFRL